MTAMPRSAREETLRRGSGDGGGESMVPDLQTSGWGIHVLVLTAGNPWDRGGPEARARDLVASSASALRWLRCASRGRGSRPGSPLRHGLPALGAELHTAGDLVPVRAFEDLRRAALPAELQARRHRLAALDAGLRARGEGRVRPAASAELHRHGVLLAALRTLAGGLSLGAGGHPPGHLGAHRVPHADPRAEAHPDA